MIFAQIEKSKIVAVFQSPQDPVFWPGVAAIEEDDPRLIEYLSAAIGAKIGES